MGFKDFLLFLTQSFFSQIGNSRSTERRKRVACVDLMKHARSYQRVDQMFARLAGKEVEEDIIDEDEAEVLTKAEERLRDNLKKVRNQKSELGKVSSFQLLRLMTLHRYFVLLLEGHRKMEASKLAAEARWTTTSNHACRCIRAWAKVYLRLGSLPEHSQGKHSKRKSLLEDQDIKKKCLEWMRSQRPQDRSAPSL